jgi:hypothetical protein
MTWIAASSIMAGGSIVGGLLGASAAKSAANTQAASAREAIAQQKAMLDTQNAQQAPYRQAGYNALNQIGKLGSGTYGIYDENGNVIGQGTGTDYLTRQFSPEDFKANIDPSYNFRLQQGNLQTTNIANQSGGLIGGNALQGLINYGQGAASQEFGNAFSRDQSQKTRIYNTLAGIAGIGQTAQGQVSNLAQNTAGNIGQATIGAGNAMAGGQVGAANALSGGFQGAGNAYMMSNLLRPQTGMQAPSGYGTPVLPNAPSGLPYNVA